MSNEEGIPRVSKMMGNDFPNHVKSQGDYAQSKSTFFHRNQSPRVKSCEDYSPTMKGISRVQSYLQNYSVLHNRGTALK
jgi:hypothetical protein